MPCANMEPEPDVDDLNDDFPEMADPWFSRPTEDGCVLSLRAW